MPRKRTKLKPDPFYSHDWQVHEAITASAFTNSVGLQTFLWENLEVQELFATSPDSGAIGILSPSGWLKWGGMMEDGQLYGTYVPRALDHFHTVSPNRTPGQVYGITDATGGPLIYKTTSIGIHFLSGGFITNL